MPLALALLASGAGPGGGFDPLDPSGWGNAFWTWVIFLLALPLMIRFVFGPIAKALDRRDAQARADADAAAASAAAAAADRDEAQHRLDRVKEQEVELLAQVRAKGDQLQRELLEQARAEAERQLARARLAIEQEKTEALAELRRETVDLALRAAGKALGRTADESDQRRFLEELLAGPGPERPA